MASRLATLVQTTDVPILIRTNIVNADDAPLSSYSSHMPTCRRAASFVRYVATHHLHTGPEIICLNILYGNNWQKDNTVCSKLFGNLLPLPPPPITKTTIVLFYKILWTKIIRWKWKTVCQWHFFRELLLILQKKHFIS